MSGTTATTGPATIVSERDLGTGDDAAWQFWMGQDRIAEKQDNDWRKRGQRIIDRFRDERGQASTPAAAAAHRFNILWSNVQTLQPVLYARTPKAAVQRRFLDKDPVGRLASQILERALDYSLEATNFDDVMNPVVLDRLLPGRGTARVLYTPVYGDPLADDPEEQFDDTEEADATVAGPGDEEPDDPEPGAATPANPMARGMGDNGGPALEELREVVSEEVTLKYVFWGDYREAPARTWDEVEWVRFQSYMTRAELKKRFGAKGDKAQLDYTPKGSTQDDDTKAPPPDIFKKARVWEFWDKAHRRVVWIAPGTPDLVLDEKDDPLGLPDFFPVPAPLLATTTTDTRIPVPDYAEYQDQADELDVLTQRIDRLTRALRMVGLYAGSEKATIQQMMDPGTENRLIPVEDWGAIMGKGGLDTKGMIQWLPMGEIANVLIQLCDMRDRSKQIIYEITGIGDIIRGATTPTETATAQKLKASFATRRQEPEQKRVARFARDCIRLMGAVMAEHFSAETFSQITGFPELEPVPELPPAPQAMIPAPQPMGAPQGMAQGAVA